jgi:two-component system NtrC family sensor kinase
VRALKERDALLREQTRLHLTRSERLAAIGRLAAGVAHEINNPLTGVLTFAHMLLRSAAEGSQEREDAQTVIDATMRCKEIVQGLLNFSRQEEPRKSLAQLNEVVGNALRLTRNQAKIGQVVITEDLAGDLPQLVIDENQIQEVTVNIIVNAIDAMSQGGALRVCTRVATRDGSQWAELEISDTGCGISGEDLDHVFDPFFTTKQSGKGTGLGLSVSYGIVVEHHGEIDVESTPGESTTFTVRLPVVAEEANHDV